MEELCEKLHMAICHGNIEVVEEIISNKEVNINIGYGGSTHLITAVSRGHLNIVRRLLQHPEVDINASVLGDDTAHFIFEAIFILICN